LPIRNQIIDNILLFNVLEQVYEYRHAIIELYRVIKKGGKLYGIVPFMMNIHGDPDDFHSYTPETFRRSLAEANFRNIETMELYGRWLIIGQIPSLYPFLWGLRKPILWFFWRLNELTYAVASG
jgi:ubiquinone/menaquinone biosynthesis C-methylase UbiE